MFAYRVVRYIILINYFNEYKRNRTSAPACTFVCVLRANIVRERTRNHHPPLMGLKQFICSVGTAVSIAGCIQRRVVSHPEIRRLSGETEPFEESLSRRFHGGRGGGEGGARRRGAP